MYKNSLTHCTTSIIATIVAWWLMPTWCLLWRTFAVIVDNAKNLIHLSSLNMLCIVPIQIKFQELSLKQTLKRTALYETCLCKAVRLATLNKNMLSYSSQKCFFFLQLSLARQKVLINLVCVGRGAAYVTNWYRNGCLNLLAL